MESNKLRQQLIHSKTQISDLQDELKEQNNLYLNAIKERDSGIEKLNSAKDSLNRFEALVKQQVDRALEKERKVHNDNVKDKDILESKNKSLQEEKYNLQDKINKLEYEIDSFKNNMPENANQSKGMNLSLKKTDELKNIITKKDKEIEKLQQQVNYVQDQIEDFMAENKILRQHAGVPANYGKDREAVRLLDREKIDDFKKLIRVLQDDNYRLEEERAKLKHMLKQQSLMVSGNNKEEPRYARHKLNPDQYSRLDEFVLRLINRDVNENSDFYALKQENQKLKIQMEALSDKGFDYIKDQMEDMFKNFGKTNGISDDQFQRLLLSYEELKHKLENINIAGGNDPSVKDFHSVRGQTMTGFSYLQPPLPQTNYDGSITQGFSHKFNQQLSVTGKNGEEKGMDSKDLFDNAFLQLQLQECFEINSKKEESLKTQKREIDTLHNRIKKYVLMQDHLYKDFVRMEKDHSKNILSLENASREFQELLSNEQKKVHDLENLVKHQRSDFGSEEKNRLIELTKLNSLLEINLTKITRKYQNLEEQEKLLRRNYSNIEQEMSDMEVNCIQRINSLKEWKRNASYQLNQLYEQLRVAYPQAEFEGVLKELDIARQEKADLLLRNTESAEKISNLQAELRKVTDSVMEQRELTEYKNDLEKEFNLIRLQLEQFDPQYKWENYIFQQIVDKLKDSQVSVSQAFEQFDVNKNGHLNKKEMYLALIRLGIDNLTDSELERIIDSIDMDKSGQIEYKEFSRKLQRCGLKQLSQQERIMFNIIKSLNKLKLSKSDLFDFINKDRDGIVSRRDFQDMLNTNNFQDVSKQDIERFIDYFYKDDKGGIDLSRFIRIFESFERKFESKQQSNETVNKKRKFIHKNIIERKQKIFKQINTSLQNANASLRTFFKSIDVDSSLKINFNEFQNMFRQMQIKISEQDCKEIFDSIDLDGSQQIDWAELQLDFNKCISKSLDDLVEDERILNIGSQDDMMQDTYNQGNKGYSKNLGTGMNNMKELEFERKIASLEDKVKQAFLELKNENALRNLHNETLLLLQKHHEDLRKQYDNTKAEYFKLQKNIKEKDQIISQSVRKGEAETIKRDNIKLRSEMVETRSALLSYKNMHNVIAEQVKQLKLMHDRSKDENESLIQTLRDIQSENFDKQKFGKMYYVVMLSRWQEAAVNKKYDMKLNECKELKGEIFNLNQEVENKEKDYISAENEVKKNKVIVLGLKKELQGCKNMFLNIEKAEEMDRIIRQLTDERENLETQYFKVRSECIGALDMLDDARIKSEYNENLRKMDLKNLKKDEISDKLIAMSDTLQQLRLASLKAERQCREYEEKKNHLERLLQNKNEEVHIYEQNIAKMEQELHVKEEKWRNAYNDHVQKFITFKLGQDSDKIKQSEMYQKIKGDKSTGSINDASSQRQGKIGNFKLTRQKSALEAIQDEDQELDIKLARLQEDNQFKEREIQELKNQIQHHLYVIGSQVGDGQESLIEEHNFKLTSVHQQESQEMADAAYQTIKTLNEMLDQKKIQLKTKDDQIDKLRQQMMEQREMHAEKFMKLQSEVTATGKSTLANLHKFVGQERPSRDGEMQPQNFSEYEFEKVQAKLSEFVELTNIQQNQINELQMQSNADTKSLRIQLQNREKEVRQLEEEVRKEQDGRRKLARQRGEKNKELIEQFQKKMTEYETEIMKLKDKNEIMRLKTLTDKNLIPSVNDKIIVGQTGSDKKVTDLQAVVIKRDQEMVKLKDEKIKSTKEKTDLLLKFTEIEKKYGEERLKVIKYVKEKEDINKSLKTTNQILEKERYKLEIAQSEVQNMIAEKQGLGAGSRMTYTQMIEKVKELENDKFILEQQRKQMIAVNPQNQSFEYIGDALFLNKDQEITNIEVLIEQTINWLQRPGNDRLSLAAIFQSVDMQNIGEINEQKFANAMSRIGINLRKGEVLLFKEALDKNNMNQLEYKCLVRELQGIPQLEFMNKGINKLARIVEKRDLSYIQFTSQLIDPQNQTQLTLEEFKLMMNNCRAPDFQFEEDEIVGIFKDVTKATRTTGVKISVHKLSQFVYKSVHALIVEKLRISLSRMGMSVSKLFSKYDSNKDGVLDEQEFIKILTECQLGFGKNMLEILFREILDPQQNKQQKSIRITIGDLKFLFESFGSLSQEGFAPQKIKDDDIQAAIGGHPAQGFLGISAEHLMLCKKASRKILAVCHNTIVETVAKLDDLEEGIVNRQELLKALQSSNIKDLDAEELNQLLYVCDRGKKGYISSNKFIDKLYEFSAESESDQIFRRVFNTSQQINLRVELKNFDTNQLGKLDKVELRRGLKSLQITVSDNEIQSLMKEMGQQLPVDQSKSSLKRQDNYVMDINQFSLRVHEIGQTKQLPGFILQGPKGKSKTQGGSENMMAAFDSEKKYKKNLGALKTQIEEKNREIESMKKEVKECHDKYAKLDNQKKQLEARLVDKNSKPPRETNNESLAYGQAQELIQIKEQLYYQQEDNLKLRKTMEVTMKAEISRLQTEKEQLEETVKENQDDMSRLQNQINALIGKPMDALEKREELELTRQFRINQLEEELKNCEEIKNEQQDLLFKAQEQLLELKFEKETSDLQFARLQKRIQDLDQYKLSTAKISSIQKDKMDSDMQDINDLVGKTTGGKKEDNLKLRAMKSNKNVAELEMLVETLKRVIEKQKIECENLRKQNAKFEGHSDKLVSEKAMKQKINNLEQIIHSHEMKEVNLDERERTIKKLIEANKHLRADLIKEIDRYTLLEDKYKDVLIQYQDIQKSNMRNESLAFATQTGGNIHRFSTFLQNKDFE